MKNILILICIIILNACSTGVSNTKLDSDWAASRVVSAFDKSGRKIADSSNRYASRLERISARFKDLNSAEVYIDAKIDLFMLGSDLRVNSGLMDLMRDDELLSLIVKEYAHNKLNHYQNRFAHVSDGYEQALDTSFTETQNSSADAYTLNYYKQNNLNIQAVVNTAYKLARLQEKAAVGGEEISYSNRLVNKSSLDRARALANMLQESKSNEQYLTGLIQVEEPIKEKEQLVVKQDKLEIEKPLADMNIKKTDLAKSEKIEKLAKVDELQKSIKTEKELMPETDKMQAKGVKSASLKKANKINSDLQLSSEKVIAETSSKSPVTGWYLQVSAEDSSDKANKKIQSFSAANLKASIQEAKVNGKIFYRILVGPYNSKSELSVVKESGLANKDSFPRYVE